MDLDKPPTRSEPHAPNSCPKRYEGLGNDDLDNDENIRPGFLGGVFAFATVELAFAAVQLVSVAATNEPVVAGLTVQLPQKQGEWPLTANEATAVTRRPAHAGTR